jgi:predicted TIM-barrel fold metal-dependent hydrolase
MKQTRREFIAQAATAALPYAPRQSVAAIDTHTHFYDPSRQQGVPWPPPSQTILYKPHYPREFAALTQPLNVAGTVVVEASPWVEDNQWVLDLAKTNDNLVGLIGNLELGKPEFAANLQRFGKNKLFLGLRVNGRALASGLEQKAFEDDLSRLNERQYALDVVGGAAMLPDVARVAKLAPRLRIVIDHLPFGEWDNDSAALQRALADVARLPNVYAKVSNVVRRVNDQVVTTPESYRPALDALWKLFGVDRLIYGSNWPVSNRVAPYATLHKIVDDYFQAQGAAAAEKYFWRNSLAVYRWQPRGAARKLVKL